MAFIIGTNLGYILLTFLPPIIWLLFYLHEDRHPEPKLLLALTFIGGMASAILAIVGECIMLELMGATCGGGSLTQLNPLLMFLGISFIEEYVKYLPVKFLVLARCKNHAVCDLDEPVDAMIYMMTAAMGFAAFENMLFVLPILFPAVKDIGVLDTIFSNPVSWENLTSGIEVTTNRFLGANLLHALSSGIVGFFLARTFFSPRRHHFIALGIIMATLLHTTFNYLILTREAIPQGTFYLILLLVTMAVMVFIDFERLKGSAQKSKPLA